MKAEVVLINRIILHDLSVVSGIWRVCRGVWRPHIWGLLFSATLLGFPMCVLALCAGRRATDFSSSSSPLIIPRLVHCMK